MAFCQEHVSLRYFDMIQRNNFLVTQITVCLVCFVSEFRVTTYIFPPNVLYYPFNLNGHLSFNQTFHGLPWNWPVKKAVLLTELWSDTNKADILCLNTCHSYHVYIFTNYYLPCEIKGGRGEGWSVRPLLISVSGSPEESGSSWKRLLKDVSFLLERKLLLYIIFTVFTFVFKVFSMAKPNWTIQISHLINEIKNTKEKK